MPLRYILKQFFLPPGLFLLLLLAAWWLRRRFPRLAAGCMVVGLGACGCLACRWWSSIRRSYWKLSRR